MRGYSRLVKTIRKADTILILGHENADPDAVCSAYAFIALAKRLNRRLKLQFASPEGISKLSKQVLEAVPLEITTNPDPSRVDVIITVDTNTIQQLGDLKDSVTRAMKPLVMIDHHAPHEDNTKTASFVICDESATSTCEMILDMYLSLGFKPNRLTSQALFIGLIVETGHMAIANRRTFKAASRLVDFGADPQAAITLTRSTMDESERIARLKSAQRLRLERVDKWVVALSELGSYHASAARAFIQLGAQLAIVAGKREEELTISLRSTRDFNLGTGMHLGTDLANPLGKALNGMGGGHATAAGANGKGEVKDALKLAMRIVRTFITQPTKANTAASSYAEAPPQTGVITQQ